MPDKLVWFTRHARNRIRKEGVSRESVQRCIRNPARTSPSILGRINHFGQVEGRNLRVTIAEEEDRIVVVTVTVRGRRFRV